MDDNTISCITEEYGTPLYIYDYNKIAENAAKLKNSLLSSIDVFYSIKANPSLAICQIMRKLGCGAEAASAGEIFIALKSGFDPKDIIFTSPGKTEEELNYAVSKDIYCINVESVEEACLINDIAAHSEKCIDISVRINPDFCKSGSGIRMSGVSSQFGIDISQIDRFFSMLKSLKHISLIGIHVYLGTQILHSESIIENTGEIIALARQLTESYGLCLKFIDLGGGFGIPYFPGEVPLDLDELKKGLSVILNRYEAFLKPVRLIVESGRFLTAESGCYVTKVLYRKESKDASYLVCDGGSNHHASSAFLGRYIRNNFPMHVLNKRGGSEKINVVGPLCTPADVIGQKVELPETLPGDYIVIEKSGAYGLTNSPVNFLSRAQPAEVLYSGGKTYLIRERGRMEDLTNGQHILPEEV